MVFRRYAGLRATSASRCRRPECARSLCALSPRFASDIGWANSLIPGSRQFDAVPVPVPADLCARRSSPNGSFLGASVRDAGRCQVGGAAPAAVQRRMGRGLRVLCIFTGMSLVFSLRRAFDCGIPAGAAKVFVAARGTLQVDEARDERFRRVVRTATFTRVDGGEAVPILRDVEILQWGSVFVLKGIEEIVDGNLGRSRDQVQPGVITTSPRGMLLIYARILTLGPLHRRNDPASLDRDDHHRSGLRRPVPRPWRDQSCGRHRVTHLAVAQGDDMVAIDLHVAAVSRFGQGADLRAAGNTAEKTQRVARASRVGEPGPVFVTELNVPTLVTAHTLATERPSQVDTSRAPFSLLASDARNYRGVSGKAPAFLPMRQICASPSAVGPRRSAASTAGE